MVRCDEPDAYDRDGERGSYAPGRERCARGDSEQERQSKAAADGNNDQGSGAY